MISQFFSSLLIWQILIECRWSLHAAAMNLELPLFPTMVRRFLYDQLYPDSTIPSEDILEDSYPEVKEKIHVFNSAIAIFWAPSDLSNIDRMRREHIRATSLWRNAAAQYDCVLVNLYPDLEGAQGFEVGRVFLFFSFRHCDKVYSCALIQWFSFVGSEPDEDTGMWTVEPDFQETGESHLSIIHTDSIYRAVHLLPVYRTAEHVKRTITMHLSLDTFRHFYINKFADHHTFETLF